MIDLLDLLLEMAALRTENRELRAAVQALTARVRTDLEALEMEREK